MDCVVMCLDRGGGGGWDYSNGMDEWCSLWTTSVHVDRFTMFSEIFRERSLLANLRAIVFSISYHLLSLFEKLHRV